MRVLKYIQLICLMQMTLIGINQSTWSNHYGETEDQELNPRAIELINEELVVFYSDNDSLQPADQLNILKISLEGDTISRTRISEYLVGRYGGGNNGSDYNEFIGTTYVSLYDMTDSEIEEEIYCSELFLLDEQLDTIWTETIGNNDQHHVLYQARFTENNEIIAVGSIDVNDSHLDVLLVKYDLDGNEIWSQTITIISNYHETGYSVVPTTDGGFIIGGEIRQDFNTPNSHLICKTDSNGNLLNHQIFGNYDYYHGWANINSLSDGNFIYGSAWSNDGEIYHYYLCKFNEDLEILWSNQENFNEEFCFIHQIKETQNQNLIAVGLGIFEDEQTTEYANFMKFDSEGNLLWERKYRHATEGWLTWNRLYDVVEIPGEGYAACGERLSTTDSIGRDVWVIKVDTMGCLVPGCDTLVSITEIPNPSTRYFSYGPNPASDILNLYLSSLVPYGSKLEIIDMTGKVVEQYAIEESDITWIVDVKSYPTGSYIFKLSKKGQVLQTERILIER